MKIKSNRLISILLSTIMCLTVLTGAAWALTGLFEVGMSIQVTYDPLVDAKVYLSIDSAGAEDSGLKQMKADYSEITAKNFVKENSALVLNTHDDDKNSGAKTKNDFEALGNSDGLICNANGEMQFYVYVENYSTENNVYYEANISFTNSDETTPFSVIEKPLYAVSETVSGSSGGGRVTSSLLAFKIKAKNLGEGLKSDQIKIEINLNTLIVSLFKPTISTLELASWNSIKQISEAGLASQFFKIGDEKTITLTTSEGVTEEVTLVILGFDHDDLTSGGKAGITFGMKNLLATPYAMNSSNTNVGGWNSSAMRSRMTNTFLTQLDIDLQSVIKEVNKPTTAGNKSPSIITSQDKLFLFSESEINGTGYAEGSQYQYYANNDINARKKGNNWWLRSPYVGGSNYFRYFDGGGAIGSYYADGTRGVCFGFCV